MYGKQQKQLFLGLLMDRFKSSRLEWRQGFSVGIPRIDEQHRGMIDALNEIGEAMEAGDSNGCDRLFGKFLSLSRDHFEAEERVLFASEYPKAQEHADHHRHLLAMAEEAREECRRLIESNNLTTCFNTLLEFLIGDLLEADIQFKSFLEEMDAVKRSRLN